MFEIHEIIENDEYLKPLTDEDWIKPGRPATEQEFIQMLEEAEKGPFYTIEEARAQTLKYYNEIKNSRK